MSPRERFLAAVLILRDAADELAAQDAAAAQQGEQQMQAA